MLCKEVKRSSLFSFGFFFLHHRISITLQRIQASSISSGIMAIGLATSQLPPFHDTLDIVMIDLLQVVGC
jgi:hypothetical protein